MDDYNTQYFRLCRNCKEPVEITFRHFLSKFKPQCTSCSYGGAEHLAKAQLVMARLLKTYPGFKIRILCSVGKLPPPILMIGPYCPASLADKIDGSSIFLTDTSSKRLALRPSEHRGFPVW